MKNIHVYILALTIGTLLSSCKKASDDPAPAQDTGEVHVEFDNQFKQDDSDPEQYDPLVFNTQTYTNANGDDYTITMFKYYISNVKLKRANGTYYNVPESYFLIDAGAGTDGVITLSDIPAGNYTGMSYLIGVDSTRNVSGAQTGALDVSKNMYWDWNMGYIFLKLEGTSPESSQPGNTIQYHIGGFRNANHSNALQTVTHDFGSSVLRVTKVGAPKVHIMVEASKVAENISFATTPAVHMPGATAVSISEGYKEMFHFDHVHN